MRAESALGTGIRPAHFPTALRRGFWNEPWDILAVSVALVFLAVAWPTFFVTHALWVVLVPVLAAAATLPVAVLRYIPFA